MGKGQQPFAIQVKTASEDKWQLDGYRLLRIGWSEGDEQHVLDTRLLPIVPVFYIFVRLKSTTPGQVPSEHQFYILAAAKLQDIVRVNYEYQLNRPGRNPRKPPDSTHATISVSGKGDVCGLAKFLGKWGVLPSAIW